MCLLIQSHFVLVAHECLLKILDHGRGQMFQDHSQVHHHSDDRGGNFYNAQGYPQSKKMDIPNGRVHLHFKF